MIKHATPREKKMSNCSCGANQPQSEHTTACLYGFAIAFLNLDDTEDLRKLFWFAHDKLEFDENDKMIIPERE